ncbi:MAG: DUF374 domain-containing protein [Spirochaetaceae bacterium]|nr:MAG: DUF374 domain-containing protein [Spirochaetaceae bacterium]
MRVFSIITRLFLIAVYRTIGNTVRIVDNPIREVRKYHRQGRRVIFALWHEYSVVGIFWYRHRHGSALVANSWKGDVLGNVLRHFGTQDFRARDEKRPLNKAQGILGFVKYLRDGHDGSITVDGPFGPARRGKPGILQIAAKTGHLIVPVGAYFSHSLKVRGRWDDYRIPIPFGRLHIVLGDPIEVPSDYRSREQELLEQLDSATNEAEERAKRAAKTYWKRRRA